MKVQYKLANGQAVVVEVSAEIALYLDEQKRAEENFSRKERWRNEASLDAFREETGWEPADPYANVEVIAEANEERERVDRLVSRLTDKQQNVFRLYFFDGCTAKEIAKDLGVSESAVLQQLVTIRKNLKKLL
ncbi:MAG: sigma-70 family RNA polymerase sigma factor [Firmicutes bacterium]|nr:sigma-70 family RNA polymerase sigma factor [Bacillota bacterium]